MTQHSKKTVFLTGATGTMGFAGLKEIVKKLDHIDLVILARPSEKNKKLLAPYVDKIQVIWGDLNNYDDVLKGVSGADIVLHVGGMVSPAADYKPVSTRRVNLTAAQHIVNATLAQPQDHQPKVVYIGSVAQLGHRPEPIHWGRTGDPIVASIYDHYAISKSNAEKLIAESGIKHWVSLRQSGILYPAILKNYDPIMFHVPIRGTIEWATVEDSGRLLANICDTELPDHFWNRFYNIGSGPEYRLSNYEFECLLLKTISCPPPEKIFETNWFITKNFHGHWYIDSQKLEDFLHFRANIPVEQYFKDMGKSIPWFYHLSKLCPPALIKKFAMKPLTQKPVFGTMDWIKTRDENRISAYYGSYRDFEKIPGWDQFDTSRPSSDIVQLDHGYDESKPLDTLDLNDMKQAAHFRGGQCLSDTMQTGDLTSHLRWKCQFGHEFNASPTLVLLGGHWCPECMPTPWNYDEIAKDNPFFAQVWYASHNKEEHHVYGEDIFKGWE